MDLPGRHGRWALVLGASEGLGLAWAHGLAAAGHDVLLVSRRQQVLDGVAAEIRAAHGVDAIAHACDLGAPDVWEQLAPALEGRDVGVAVYNACFSRVGTFLDLTLEEKLTTLDVNARGVLIVTHHLAARFAAQKRGALVLMSSMAGFQGSAMVGTYAATKAFDTVLGDVLWEELRCHGVDVMVCAAGATLTPQFEMVTPEHKRTDAFPMSPDEVVSQALAALWKRRGPVFVPGGINRFASGLFRWMPRRLAVRLLSRQTRGMYGEQP